MRKWLGITILACALLEATCYAGDVEVRLHEHVLNSAIRAIGPVKGSGEFDTPIGKKTYTWSIKNPQLSVVTDGLEFTAITTVDLSGFNYDTVASGKMGAQLNTQTSKIDLTIKRASFSLDFNVFGNKIHLTDVDISAALRQPIAIKIPTFNQTVQLAGDPYRPTKNIQLSTGTPNIQFAPPFLVIESPLIVE